jgi:gamma-glutamyl AIG2-like cyclotransferase
VREASVRGRLHELSFGFPALVVPESDVQAIGTADYLADVEKQNRALSDPRASSSGWDTIYGELMIFVDPDERLVAFDALEGYVPGEESLYERVLIPVEAAGEVVLAWAYRIRRATGIYLSGGHWPAP